GGASPYTLAETGHAHSVRTETDDAATGATSVTITGSDTATLVESGSNSVLPGGYTETIVTTESFAESDTGNANSGAITRNGQATGTFTKTLTPSGSTSVQSSGSLNPTFHETGNGTAGGIIESVSGTSRYSLLESWTDESQGSGVNGTGNV